MITVKQTSPSTWVEFMAGYGIPLEPLHMRPSVNPRCNKRKRPSHVAKTLRVHMSVAKEDSSAVTIRWSVNEMKLEDRESKRVFNQSDHIVANAFEANATLVDGTNVALQVETTRGHCLTLKGFLEGALFFLEGLAFGGGPGYPFV